MNSLDPQIQEDSSLVLVPIMSLNKSVLSSVYWPREDLFAGSGGEL